MKFRSNWIQIIIALVACFFLYACDRTPSPPEKMQQITIAVIPHSFTGYSLFLAQEKGYFEREGLKVTFRFYPHGKATLKALSNQETDLAVSSETPFMHAVMDGAEIAAFGVTIKAKKHLAVVARRDRGIESAKDLRGKRIGVTLGTNGEYFLDTFLLLNEIERSDIHTVHLLPGEMIDAITKGDVDAVAAWNPPKHMAERQLGNNGKTFYAEKLYTPFFLIVARKSTTTTDPALIVKVVKALQHASEFILNNTREANALVASHLGADATLMNELAATYDFHLTLSQALLLTLENQSEWAIQKGLSERKSVPNYIKYLYLDALEEVAPRAMKIIH